MTDVCVQVDVYAYGMSGRPSCAAMFLDDCSSTFLTMGNERRGLRELTSAQFARTDDPGNYRLELERGHIIREQVRRTATVYRSKSDIRILGPNDQLEGYDVLPGFALPLSRLFAF